MEAHTCVSGVFTSAGHVPAAPIQNSAAWRRPISAAAVGSAMVLIAMCS